MILSAARWRHVFLVAVFMVGIPTALRAAICQHYNVEYSHASLIQDDMRCSDRPWNDCSLAEQSSHCALSSSHAFWSPLSDSHSLDYRPLKIVYVDAPRPKGSILILTSERRLLYFLSGMRAIEFPIGVARRNLQKLGQTQIIMKRKDPTWVPTVNQRKVYRGLPASVPPGPKNPLGTRALNLTIPNIRIHGTNNNASIGAAVSDGCFHMYNRDVEHLFEMVSVGTKVTILK